MTLPYLPEPNTRLFASIQREGRIFRDAQDQRDLVRLSVLLVPDKPNGGAK